MVYSLEVIEGMVNLLKLTRGNGASNKDEFRGAYRANAHHLLDMLNAGRKQGTERRLYLIVGLLN